MLEKAIKIAAEAHEGQTDKAGEAYILHPLRVMLAQNNDTARMVAVLHDAIEDTWVTIDRLKLDKFPEDVIDAIIAVTRKGQETYEEYLSRCKANEIGLAVKLADIADNMDNDRLAKLPHKKASHLRQKYYQALIDLTE